MDFAKVSFVFVKNSIEFNQLCGIIQSVFLCIAIQGCVCQKLVLTLADVRHEKREERRKKQQNCFVSDKEKT